MALRVVLPSVLVGLLLAGCSSPCPPRTGLPCGAYGSCERMTDQVCSGGEWKCPDGLFQISSGCTALPCRGQLIYCQTTVPSGSIDVACADATNRACVLSAPSCAAR